MKKLTSKEQLFCRFYIETQNLREAAAKAGYSFPSDKLAIRLLQRPEINQEVERLTRLNQKPCEEEIAAGFRRIAFGSIADAVRLLFLSGEVDAGQLEQMDLYCISEIKHPKGGGMEIKFFDRLKALEKLSEISNSTSDSVAPFYQALERSANKLETASRESSAWEEN